MFSKHMRLNNLWGKLFLFFSLNLVSLFIISVSNTPPGLNINWGITNNLAANDKVKINYAKKIGINDQLTVTISLSGNIQQAIFKSDGFVNLGHRSTSTSISVINGKSTRSVNQSYQLKPKKKGKLNFKVKINQKIYGPYNVEVVDGSVSPSQPNARQRNRIQQMFDPFQMIQAQQPRKLTRDAVIIENQLSKKKLYINEIGVVDTVLFYDPNQLNITGIGIASPFNHSGLNLIQVEDFKPTRKTIIRNGKNYIRQVIIRNLAYPIVKGKSKVENGAFQVRIQNGFLGSQILEVKVNPVTIVGRAYPTKKDFRNQYGDFSVKANLSSQQIEVNEPITLKVEISGSGNFYTMNSPLDLNLPNLLSPNVRIKQGTITDNFKVSDTTIKGKKTYEYYVIPTQVGSINLDPIQFTSYFPNKKKVATISEKLPPLTVKKNQDPALTKTILKKSGSSLKEDIRYIATEVPNLKSFWSVWQTYHGIGLLALLFLFIPNFFEKHRSQLSILSRLSGRGVTTEIQLEKQLNQLQKTDFANLEETATALNQVLLSYLPTLFQNYLVKTTEESPRKRINIKPSKKLINEKIKEFQELTPLEILKRTEKLRNKLNKEQEDKYLFVKQKIDLLNKIFYSKKNLDFDLVESIEEIKEKLIRGNFKNNPTTPVKKNS